jgi:hypothetical protein
MDVVTELSARAATYIGLLQDALALLRPGTPGLKVFDPAFEGPLVLELDPKLLTEDQVRPYGLLWQKFYGNAQLLASALELAAPEKKLLRYKLKPGEALPPELQEGLQLFARQAHQLLMKVLLPNKGFLVNKLTERCLVMSPAFITTTSFCHPNRGGRPSGLCYTRSQKLMWFTKSRRLTQKTTPA